MFDIGLLIKWWWWPSAEAVLFDEFEDNAVYNVFCPPSPTGPAKNEPDVIKAVAASQIEFGTGTHVWSLDPSRTDFHVTGPHPPYDGKHVNLCAEWMWHDGQRWNLRFKRLLLDDTPEDYPIAWKNLTGSWEVV